MFTWGRACQQLQQAQGGCCHLLLENPKALGGPGGMLRQGVGGTAASAWHRDEQCLRVVMEKAFKDHSKSSWLMGTWLWGSTWQDLRGEHGEFLRALLSLSGICPLMKRSLLTPSHGFSVQVLTVLCNIAEKGPGYCQQLHQQPALPLLLPTLTLPNPEVVGQCLELLHLLFLHWPEVRAGGYLPQNQAQHHKAVDGDDYYYLNNTAFSHCHASPPLFSTQTRA